MASELHDAQELLKEFRTPEQIKKLELIPELRSKMRLWVDNTIDPETRPIIKRDTVDALDFIWVIEYETAYEGTTSTYTDAVMISYQITHLNDGMMGSESVDIEE